MKKETADYSAITTWGVFYPNEDSGPNIILLASEKGRWEFPDLKRIALKTWNYWEPDIAIIEAKASGLPLLQELRAVGIPVSNFTPSRGQDKNSRLHAIAPLFEAGLVWAPDTKWAEEVMEECAEFPNGDHDDLMDSTTQALLRFRQGSFIKHPEDYKDEKQPKEKKIYY
jgi:predicted phage terminase large subunit-like protein